VIAGFLVLDKPAGLTSHDVVAAVRAVTGLPKVGHTGTLDPFATGLLPLAFGEATKFSRFLIDASKSYVATLRLGAETTTGDPEGPVIRQRPIVVTSTQIDEVLAGFVGFRDRIPPMHSAVHVGGKRLYELAREGLEIERPARRIEVEALSRRHFAGDSLEIAVTCSKGTYVRTLAQDIGEALGCGAYLVGLRRTAVGGFSLAEATSLERLEALGIAGARTRLLPVDVLVKGLPRRDCGRDDALRFTQGQSVSWAEGRPGDDIALYGPAGTFLGVARCESPGRAAPLRLMATGGSGKLPDFA